MGTAFCCSLRCLVVAGVRGAEGDVVIAALDDAGGGDERELRVFLEVWDGRHAAVAHGRLDLIKASCDVILQRACVGDVRVDALFKGKTRLTAQVVALPAAATTEFLQSSKKEVLDPRTSFFRRSEQTRFIFGMLRTTARRFCRPA